MPRRKGQQGAIVHIRLTRKFKGKPGIFDPIVRLQRVRRRGKEMMIDHADAAVGAADDEVGEKVVAKGIAMRQLPAPPPLKEVRGVSIANRI